MLFFFFSRLNKKFVREIAVFFFFFSCQESKSSAISFVHSQNSEKQQTFVVMLSGNLNLKKLYKLRKFKVKKLTGFCFKLDIFI